MLQISNTLMLVHNSGRLDRQVKAELFPNSHVWEGPIERDVTGTSPKIWGPASPVAATAVHSEPFGAMGHAWRHGFLNRMVDFHQQNWGYHGSWGHIMIYDVLS